MSNGSVLCPIVSIVNLQQIWYSWKIQQKSPNTKSFQLKFGEARTEMLLLNYGSNNVVTSTGSPIQIAQLR